MPFTLRTLRARSCALALSLAAGGAGVAHARSESAPAPVNVDVATFKKSIRLVENMPYNDSLVSRAARRGLDVLDVTWEDTGRDYGSSVGPNISDVTLQLREPIGDGTRFRPHLLPVLRHPNFTDKTADIPAEELWVKVGNQSAGAQLVSVPLSEVLTHLREYVSNPESVVGTGDFSAKRDTHYLVSAQHVFVPVPKTGKVEFTPAVFNYQSIHRHPAVLTLLVTRQGTSMAVIENSGSDVALNGYGQQLFFNNHGQKTTLTVERKSDVQTRIESGNATAQDDGALADGADMVMIIQVPLKVAAQRRMDLVPMAAPSAESSGPIGGLAMPMKEAKSMSGAGQGRAVSDVEAAVLGHGDDLGEIAEGRGLKLTRDPRFPVRVTVQFYKATSNGVVSNEDLVAAKAEIDKVYAKGTYVGSLVVPEAARTRPTDWHLGETQPVKIVEKTTVLPVHAVDLDAVEGVCGHAVASRATLWDRVRSWLF